MPFFLLGFISCTPEVIEDPNTIKQYLHLSHTKTEVNPKMDSTAETIDYSRFDMLWLGGDLAVFTSRDDSTMAYADSIFDLGNERTLWTLGNHDYPHVDRIEQFTNRPPYYVYSEDKMTVVVLDTQEDRANIDGPQKDFLFEIIDSLKSTTHLILLHHKLVWMQDHPELESQINDISNGEAGNCGWCLFPNNFNSVIYPKLVEATEKGIEVICIGGDIGKRVNEFEYLTDEGIHFLASGIEAEQVGNQALLFSHNITTGQITWEYKFLTDL